MSSTMGGGDPGRQREREKGEGEKEQITLAAIPMIASTLGEKAERDQHRQGKIVIVD